MIRAVKDVGVVFAGIFTGLIGLAVCTLDKKYHGNFIDFIGRLNGRR